MCHNLLKLSWSWRRRGTIELRMVAALRGDGKGAYRINVIGNSGSGILLFHKNPFIRPSLRAWHNNSSQPLPGKAGSYKRSPVACSHNLLLDCVSWMIIIEHSIQGARLYSLVALYLPGSAMVESKLGWMYYPRFSRASPRSYGTGPKRICHRRELHAENWDADRRWRDGHHL